MSIGFNRMPANPLDGSDSEFLQKLQWSDAAPKKMKKAAAKGDATRFVLGYRAWLEPFATRFRKRSTSLLSFIDQPVDERSGLAALVTEYVRTGENASMRFGLGHAIVGWLRAAYATGLSGPAERLLVMELLLNPPLDMETETWCRLWRLALVDVGQPVDTGSSTEADLVAALFFGPLQNAAATYAKSVRQVVIELDATTDTDGTPKATAARCLGKWLTPFVRAAWWGRSFRQSIYVQNALSRFQHVVTRAAELSGGDGTFALERLPHIAGELLPIAAKVAGWNKNTAVGRMARSNKVGKNAGKPPYPSSQSDWSEAACLRSNRSAAADMFAIAHDQPSPPIDLACLGIPVLSGPWHSQLTVAGKPADLSGEWSCTCWHSDEDGDYLELSLEAGAGVTIARQVFLSRQQHFAMLMDSVSTSRDSAITYRSQLPTAAHVMARADFISREWRLHTGSMSIRVFPVSLEFDRVLSCPGDCGVEDGSLFIEAQGQHAVNASLVLDWHPQRCDTQAEWNRLTVTESRKTVSAAAAAAFRVRLGDHQVMSYRGIDGSQELRAVLGQHSNHETIIGTLNGAGKFSPLVHVDAADA